MILRRHTTQAESPLHSLKQATGHNDLNVNVNKTGQMCFKQEGPTFTLSVEPLKLVNKFTCLGSSISSTESDDNIRLAKGPTSVDKLLTLS